MNPSTAGRRPARTLHEVLSGQYDNSLWDQKMAGFVKSSNLADLARTVDKLALMQIAAQPAIRQFAQQAAAQSRMRAKFTRFAVSQGPLLQTSVDAAAMVARVSHLADHAYAVLSRAADVDQRAPVEVASPVPAPTRRTKLTRAQVLAVLKISADLITIAQYMQDPSEQHALTLLGVILFATAIVYWQSMFDQ